MNHEVEKANVSIEVANYNATLLSQDDETMIDPDFSIFSPDPLVVVSRRLLFAFCMSVVLSTYTLRLHSL